MQKKKVSSINLPLGDGAPNTAINKHVCTNAKNSFGPTILQ